MAYVHTPKNFLNLVLAKAKAQERRVLQSRFSRQEPETVDILAHAWIRWQYRLKTMAAHWNGYRK